MCASFFVHLSGTVCPRDDNTSLFDIKRSELPNNGHSRIKTWTIGYKYKIGDDRNLSLCSVLIASEAIHLWNQ